MGFEASSSFTWNIENCRYQKLYLVLIEGESRKSKDSKEHDFHDLRYFATSRCLSGEGWCTQDPCLKKVPGSRPPKRSQNLEPSTIPQTPQTMADFKPYTYFQCPCTDSFLPVRNVGSESPTAVSEISEQDDRTFDPRAPRSNYSLYPLEHLLYCEDCHQIRCPRCVLDEIVTHYCPNCLFEVPNSIVKSEGTRYGSILGLGRGDGC